MYNCFPAISVRHVEVDGYPLVDFDHRGNPLGLQAGLGNLPLYADNDGWYSVLGSWNGATNDPETANGVGEVNSENNLAILIAPLRRPRSPRPGIPSISCQYHTSMRCNTPAAALILVPRADLPAKPRIAPGLEASKQSKASTDITAQSTSMTAWIAQLKGACGSEIGGSSGRIIFIPTC
ncbi:hypothetical protein HOY80DRAFT_1002312 [Tuber brumale]|nr:hypothetical protein HOY80DRAFT_1002312 [Tuber brumale]